VISTVANKGAAGVISCFHRNRPRSAIPWRRATSEKRESGRIASEVSAVCLLRQTCDDDLARGWTACEIALASRPRQRVRLENIRK
jgi:hypothetical protein